MTTKETRTTKTQAKEAPQELELAWEIHTLAQTIYGRLAATHPWLMTFSAPSMFSVPEEWPPRFVNDPCAGAWKGPQWST